MKVQGMPHIVILRRPPDAIVWGGLERLCLDWLRRIDYQQCRVSLVVSEPSREIYVQKCRAAGTPVNIVGTLYSFDRFFFFRLGEALRLLGKLRPNKVVFLQGRFGCFDLAYVLAAWVVSRGQVYMHENLGAPEPCANSNRRYFGIIPGLGLWWLTQKYSMFLRAIFSRKILAVSQEVRQRMISLWHYPASKVIVSYHGVDVEHFSPCPDTKVKMRETLKIPMTDTVIILTARLSKEKCVHRAIEAFASLSGEFSNSRMMILGDGPLEGDLKLQAQRTSCAERIMFLGHLDKVADHLKMSDIFVLPSDNEGLSLAFLEAMSCGLIPVVTSCPGPNEIVKDGFNGFLVAKSTEGVIQGLRQAMSLTLNQRQTIVANAREYVQQHFEIERNVVKTLALMGIPLRSH